MLRSRGFFAAFSLQSQPGTSVENFHLNRDRVVPSGYAKTQVSSLSRLRLNAVLLDALCWPVHL